MFPISANTILLAIAIAIGGTTVVNLFSALSDLKATADQAAVSIEARYRL